MYVCVRVCVCVCLSVYVDGECLRRFAVAFIKPRVRSSMWHIQRDFDEKQRNTYPYIKIIQNNQVYNIFEISYIIAYGFIHVWANASK